MKRFNLLMAIFSIALTLPLIYLIPHTYSGLAQEEASQLRFFTETLFQEMENALARMIYREENRSVDEYNISYWTTDGHRNIAPTDAPPLSSLPQEPFILGYFQNNPDGSFQTPLTWQQEPRTGDLRHHIERLRAINQVFNRKKYAAAERPVPTALEAPEPTPQEEQKGFADKFISKTKSEAPKAYLGRKEKRLEEITVSQARKLAQQESTVAALPSAPAASAPARPTEQQEGSLPRATSDDKKLTANSGPPAGPSRMSGQENGSGAETLKVEVTPFQTLFIDDQQVFVFRRIIEGNQVFRQGFVLELAPFFDYLSIHFFLSQPMAQFSRLDLAAGNGTRKAAGAIFGKAAPSPRFAQKRAFPAPFDFLTATLLCQDIPASAGRQTLNWVILVLAGVVLVGLLSIYQSVRSVVDLSERRSRFVSSVTHELKTPLTNIRMYIEMLEQGMAVSRQREQEYFQILGTESARLSRLINNVLELSRLEKKQRRFNLQQGRLEDVLSEVLALMDAKFKQEGFCFSIEQPARRPFAYDREVMVQIMVNLMENSLKFGRNAKVRELSLRIDQTETRTAICFSDTGPGFPGKAAKRIFDDFYRADTEITRNTGGTGIGLALVKKFVLAMGGSVRATNRQPGPGCSITLTLPS
jgi:signal transduction histidine kinase